jgi:uncharacterized membrane protein YgcG
MRRAAAIAGAIGLLAFSVVAVYVGVHEVALRLAPTSTNINGALLVVAGFIALAGSVLLGCEARRRAIGQARGLWIVVAMVVMAASTFLVFFAEVRSPTVDCWILAPLGFACLLASAGAAWLWSVPSITLGKLGATLLGAAGVLVTVYQFWYSESYAPVAAAPAVVLTAKLSPPHSAARGFVSQTAAMTVKNAGSSRLLVVGSYYMVTSSPFPAKPGHSRNPTIEDALRTTSNNLQVAHYSSVSPDAGPVTVVQAGKLLPDYYTIEPGQELAQRIVVRSRTGSDRTIRLTVGALTVKAKRVRVGRRIEFKSAEGNPAVFVGAPIKDDSWLHDLVNGNEHLLVVRYRPDLRPIGMRAELIPFHPKGPTTEQDAAVYTQHVAESLGLTNSYAIDEIAAPASVDPTRGGSSTAKGGTGDSAGSRTNDGSSKSNTSGETGGSSGSGGSASSHRRCARGRRG